MKFNVGDKVRVRYGLQYNERYNDVRCDEHMSRMGGVVLTIKSINMRSYFVKENNWAWSDEMLEPVSENTKEDKTMNKFKVGDKVRVRHGLKHGKSYDDLYCNEIMAATAGKVLTIKRAGKISYDVEENQWCWNDAMLEPVYEMFKTTPISSTSKSKENNNMNNRKVCYEIIDYKYDDQTGETYIKWDDKSETRVKPEAGTEPDQFVGFVTAYAKKAAGNTGRINSFFTQWAIKKPKLDAEEKAKKKAAKVEAKRIAEKRKAKREKWLVRKEALRIKREYEAAQLAHEEYGVPIKIEGTKLKKKSK